jgi:hypothetical protein
MVVLMACLFGCSRSQVDAVRRSHDSVRVVRNKSVSKFRVITIPELRQPHHHDTQGAAGQPGAGAMQASEGQSVSRLVHLRLLWRTNAFRRVMPHRLGSRPTHPQWSKVHLPILYEA